MTPRDLPFLWSPPRGPAGVAFIDASGEGFAAPGDSHGLRSNPNLLEAQLFCDVFTPRECDRAIALGRARPRWGGRSTSSDPEYRVCTTSWLEEQEGNRWLFERIDEVVREANALPGFELAGFGEPLHYIEYDAGGGFDWHSDLGPGRASNRKYAVSIQLSDPADYEGGQLELCPHGVMSGFRERGSALVFPAYVPHRVARVASGTRKALVAWIHGPPFR